MVTMKELQTNSNQLMDGAVDAIVELYVSQNPQANSEEFKQQLSKYQSTFQERINNGVFELLKNLREHHRWSTPGDTRKMVEEIIHAGETAALLNEENQDLMGKLEKADSMRKFLGISSTTMDRFYEIAYNQLKSNHVNEACDVFAFLCLIDPGVHIFWQGLGIAEQGRSHYDQALDAYAMAAITKVSDPFPHIYSADCYLHLNDKVQAEHSLNLAIRYASKDKKYETARIQAQKKLNQLKQK